MQLYGGLKRDQETRLANWAQQRDKRAVIARIFNLAGPHISLAKEYALASFIQHALAKRPIAIKAPHLVVRSYVATSELMSLAISLLLAAPSGVARFDSGGEPLEMQDVARAVADQLGPVPIVRPPVDPATVDRYVGDTAAYRDLLAEHSIEPTSFARQVAETVAFVALAGPVTGTGAGRIAMEAHSC